jgi:hypothetical protein
MDFVYPYFPVQFTKDGDVFMPAEVDALLSGVAAAANAPTDLFLMCHGWNNSIEDATNLYAGLAAVIKPQIDANPALKGRRFAICGVLWPSKKFEDADLIPSGAASLNDAVNVDDLKEKVRDLSSLYTAQAWPSADPATPAAFQQIEDLMETVEDDPAAQKQAVDLLRGLMPQQAASKDDASDTFFEVSSQSLINKLTRSLNPPAIPAGTGAASLDPFSDGTVSGLGGAAGFRDVLGGIKAGFQHLLNYTTYYLMKARAGTVGEKGVEPLIEKIRGARPDLRIHMIGHSFGCRLVSAAVNGLPDAAKFPDIILLLQGAFSHNGFAQKDENDDVPRGAFRDVIEKQMVRGPILITHTRNDKAVGIAYPIASRINDVVAAALGDANDKFGGLGSNGTQTQTTTPEGVAGTLLVVGSGYPFAAKVAASTPYNLKADDFIKGHSDIVHPEVGFALAVAIANNS